MNKIDLDVLFQVQYGMFVISSHLDNKINGQIATVVFQVTNEPNRFVTCLNKNNLTHEYVMQSKVFGVSILSQEVDLKFVGLFGFHSGRDINKFENVNYKTLETGSPLLLDNTSGILDVRVDSILSVGTHTLFAGELLASEPIGDKLPMSYDYYHKVAKGKTQKNAPTFRAK